jgi:hypothetical protein
MITTDQLAHLEYTILNVVESIRITLQPEPKQDNTYTSEEAQYLSEVGEALLDIQRDVEILRRSLARKEEINANSH